MRLLRLQAVHSRGQHSISFTLSRNQTVVVEYCHDNNTDMFQVSSVILVKVNPEGTFIHLPEFDVRLTAAESLASLPK